LVRVALQQQQQQALLSPNKKKLALALTAFVRAIGANLLLSSINSTKFSSLAEF
jgi:hypothetical protein